MCGGESIERNFAGDDQLSKHFVCGDVHAAVSPQAEDVFWDAGTRMTPSSSSSSIRIDDFPRDSGSGSRFSMARLARTLRA